MDSLVSIITPTYNSGRYISETIQSIQAQTYTIWELLITDDCSDDQTVDIIMSFQKNDPRIKLFSLEINSGPGPSRNNSIRMAKGKYIAFLDSDDKWSEFKLEKQISFMQKKNYIFTFTNYFKIDSQGTIIKSENNPPLKVNYTDCLLGNRIGCLTVVLDVSKLGKIYMEDLPRRQDYLLWLKILKKIDYAYSINEKLAFYRVHNKSISSKKMRLVLDHWHIYRSLENHSTLRSIWYLVNYIVRKILRSI